MKSMAEIDVAVRAEMAASAYIGHITGRRTRAMVSRIRTLGVNALARRLGVTPAHVSQVMSGKRQSRRVMEAARGNVMQLNYDSTGVAV